MEIIKEIKVKIGYCYHIVLGKISPTIASYSLYKKYTNRRLNLRKPKYLDDYLMGIKLHNYSTNDLVVLCSDKYLVREYICSNGLEYILNELYAVYNNVDSINWGELPIEFVIKLNHGSGFNLICKDRATLDIDSTKRILKRWYKTKFGLYTVEPHYLKIKKKIIVEKYLKGSEYCSSPDDYKIFCFYGIPKIIQVCTERDADVKYKLYDTSWKEVGYLLDDYRSNKDFSKPKVLTDMLDIACKLSNPFPFVRVDLFLMEEKIIFSELTFTPFACSCRILNSTGQIELAREFQSENLI